MWAEIQHCLAECCVAVNGAAQGQDINWSLKESWSSRPQMCGLFRQNKSDIVTSRLKQYILLHTAVT
ncbi:hypothetical protein E2C01_016622 [Portunus trituberculatus]|uniref:Uncharacterized protein n=1 Tax=Portunus trituberculatus TaxID=210409 RepID=A0A5B7DQQ2_PORTR|nr:hypothetical protein [Portunus trituberculatus]